MVIAGAGTGKTTVLLEKIKSILTYEQVHPSTILLLTFSRKAANELQERLAVVLGEGMFIPAWTFHSFCFSLLNEFSDSFFHCTGFRRRPSLVTDQMKFDFFSQFVYPNLRVFKGMPAAVAIEILHHYTKLDKRILKKLEILGIDSIAEEVLSEYGKYKVENNFIEYEEMITMVIDRLQIDPVFRQKISQRYTYILVDEFQDTADNNFELIKLLLPDSGGNLFIVGDDWQSIYGFRNAKVGYMLDIHKYFPDAVIHKLRVNYRSRKEIVTLSSKFISRNRFRSRKKLVSWKGAGGIVKFFGVNNSSEEREIINTLMSTLYHKGTIAVLARNNAQVNHLKKEYELRRMKSPDFLTMHAAKGLEFDFVIISGVSDLVIPDRLSDLEEERRLFYVALTRAKEQLYIIVHVNEQGIPALFGKELGIKKFE